MTGQLSHTAYATPRSIHEDGPVAKMHVHYAHGSQTRTVVVSLDREDLLRVIANAADALRLLDIAEGTDR